MLFEIKCLHSAYIQKRGIKMRLTKSVVEHSSLPLKGQTFLWDSDVKGFGVRLTPSGRTYIAQGRVKGVERRVSLGRHGILTVQEARNKARAQLSSMLDGVDPVVEKKRSDAYSLTLERLSEKYIAARRDLKPSYIADIKKHVSKSFASWADRPAVEITRDKVATLFRELTERSPAQANQALRVLRALLNYARAAYRPGDQPLIVENPVKILSDAKLWNRIQARSGRIPTEKIGAAWNVIRELRNAPDQTRIGETLADAVSFLLLTGARWSEGAALAWDRVNLEDQWWHLPDPKNRKPLTFPMPKAAVEILERRDNTNPFIFPARSGDGHIREARGVLEKVSTAVGVRVTPHDLRRTFRAVAGECGVEFWKTKLLMGHKISGDVTISHYTETSDLRYLAPESNAIAAWIIRQGKIAASDNVVQLPVRVRG
ncbi:MAG: integrase family protein [Pseudomonadota bacterium]